jgi:hypothetical protein
MLDFHPGSIAVELRQFLSTPTAIAVIQPAVPRDGSIPMLTFFVLEDLDIVDVQGS